MKDYWILPCGDAALAVTFGDVISERTGERVRALADALCAEHVTGITELVPAFCSLTVCYDSAAISYPKLCRKIEKAIVRGERAATSIRRIHRIPVCYGGEFGPDLPTVAHHAGMSEQDVISLHCAHDYLIDMLGFLPGFAYLGGLDPRLHTPRLSVPRTEIPAGSVGIGGAQTGIYPLASPGGWQIIGRSPVRPYDPERAQPILYRAGEYLRFQPITQKQYDAIEAQIAAGGYECDVIVEEV